MKQHPGKPHASHDPRSPRHAIAGATDNRVDRLGRSVLRWLEEKLCGKPEAPWGEWWSNDLADEANPPDERPTVDAPRMSSLQAFKNALTDAAALFIRHNVQPLHDEDPRLVFQLRSVDAALPDSLRSGLSILERKDEKEKDTLNLLARLLCLKAPGAAEQLDLEKFDGLNPVADDSLIEGHIVRTLLASEGARVNVSFRFNGRYITRPTAAAEAPQAHPGAGTPPQAAASRDDDGRAGENATASSREIAAQRDSAFSRVTPLAGTRKNNDFSRVTPLRPSAEPSAPAPLFHVTLLENGGERRIPVAGDGLPLAIGIAPRGRSTIVVPVECPADSYVSGQHLEITDYDPATRLLYIENRGRNGTWQGGVALPERFTLRPGSGQALSLGGPAGEGSAQLRIDAA